MQPHPDFAALIPSWDLAMRSDGYAQRTVGSYHQSMISFVGYLAEHHPDVSPDRVRREHIRGWLVDLRETRTSNTARTWMAGVRHFFRWALAEQEITTDPTDGIRTPRPGVPTTPVLSVEEIRALLATCNGKTFSDRRDTAVIMMFVDGGLRLAELAGLTVESVDVMSGAVLVEGKGSMRSGPRRRVATLGMKACKALDSYLRVRRRHPHADKPQLWLGGRNRPALGYDGVKRMIERRGHQAGVKVHPHMYRHTWASEFRSADGSEGDLMVLGGWTSRDMLDRYGQAVAADRARRAYRERSLGDRL